MTKEEYEEARAALVAQRADINNQIQNLDSEWVDTSARYKLGEDVTLNGLSLGRVTKRVMVFNVAAKTAQPHVFTDNGHRIPAGELSEHK